MKIACLGSGVGMPGEVIYDEMREVGRILAKESVTVLTGGFGGSGMEAPARGVQQADGECVGYTLLGLPGNPFLTETVDCSKDNDCPEIQYGIRLGQLLSADGFIVAAGGGPGTMVELMAIINLNERLWEEPKRVAILRPASSGIAGWDDAMCRQMSVWCAVSEQAMTPVRIVASPREAVDWVVM